MKSLQPIERARVRRIAVWVAGIILGLGAGAKLLLELLTVW